MTSKRLGTFVAVVVTVWSLAGISWFTPAIGISPQLGLSVAKAYATTGDPDMYDKPSTGTDSGGSSSSGNTGGSGSGGGSSGQIQTDPPQDDTRVANRSTVTTTIVQTISDLSLLIVWSMYWAK